MSGTASQKTIFIEDVGTAYTYVGEAATKANTAIAMWRLRKMTYTGGLTEIQWANGTEEYDKIWNDRATYAYL